MNFGFWCSRQIVHCSVCGCNLVPPRLSAATDAAAPAAWRSSPPTAAPRRASADLVAERCDAAICPAWARSGSARRALDVDDPIRTCAPVNCCGTKRPLNPVSLGEKTCCNCTAGLDFRVSLHARLVRSKGADGEMAVKQLMGRFTT